MRKDLLEQIFGTTHQNSEQTPSNMDTMSFTSRVHALKRSLSLYEEKHEFKIGDIVVPKDNMNLYQVPEAYEPSIVVEFIDPPIQHPFESGSVYTHETYDIYLGSIAPNGVFSIFPYDSRRFRLC